MSATWQAWLPVAALGVLVAFLLAALAYMVGYGFDMRELRMWAKSELLQALASAVLVGFLIVMSQIMLDEGMAVILGQSTNPFAIGHRYLNHMSDYLVDKYRWAYGLNWLPEMTSSFYLFSNTGGPERYPFLFLKPIFSDPLHLAGHFIIQILMVIYFQQALLSFFQQKMFTVVLPLGVFLRIFPITRGAGGLLIAIAIGFFIVYPTMFAFVAKMTGENMAMSDVMNTGSASTVGVDFTQFSACEQDFESMAEISENMVSPAVISKVNQFHSFVPPIILKSVFYPMIIFAVTISFIRIAAPLLGSDISEVGQGLLKMI